MSTFKLLSDKNGEKYSLFKDGNLLCNLIKIPEGEFLREDSSKVKINSFYLGEFPVTQELYEAVTGENPSSFSGEDRPVEKVSWDEALEFCDRLTRELNLNPPCYDLDKTRVNRDNKSVYNKLKWIVTFNKKGRGFRLPSKAEWEFAAMGGKASVPNVRDPKGSETYKPYSGSKFLDLLGWYEANNKYETKPVGMKFPNKLGLYDMSGNVWEWCYDWYYDYDKTDLENPVGPKSGRPCVLRGGGWHDYNFNCRSLPGHFSLWGDDNNTRHPLGFRLVFVP